MNFLDKATIKVEAGRGGNGIVAFISEKYRPKGGPGGGDGGDGGSIIVVGNEGLSTLLHLKYNRLLKGKNGENGKNKNQHGKNAQDTIINVPCGTIIKHNGKVIADIKNHGQTFKVAQGGQGGKGNARFASSKNPAPKICENGSFGESKELVFELMLLADVGLVGFPSVGKSTIISVISNAKPEIANYPFTTITPKLGLVKVGQDSFVVADLPGLIKGASLGKGLGFRFLKHIKRCKLLVHVLDVSSENNRDIVRDYKQILEELKIFDKSLLKKKSIIVANKIDDPKANLKLNKFKLAYPNLDIIKISALTNSGIDKMLYVINGKLKKLKEVNIQTKKLSHKNYVYDYNPEPDVIIHNKGNGMWIVEGKEVLKALEKNPLNTEQNNRRFYKLLKKLEVEHKLIKRGAKDGDTIKIGHLELELST